MISTVLARLSAAGSWLRKNHAFVAWCLSVVMFAFGMYHYLKGGEVGPPPAPPPPPPPILAPLPPADEVAQVPSFGWVEDKDGAALFAAGLAVPDFRDTEAGKAALGPGQNAYLWKFVEQVWAVSKFKTGAPYPNVNQGQVGCCCGAATKHVQDCLAAIQVAQHIGPGEWRPFAVEPAYAFSRVQVLKRQIRGDGSSGFAMAQAVSQFGNLSMEKQPDGTDLSTFDPQRARAWGTAGVPAGLVGECGKYKTQTVARIKTWEDCKKALDQGYPVLLTSNQGFEGRKDRMGHFLRDADGFLAPGGSWPHAMALLGYRTGNREGGYILNSWGDAINTGPPGEENPPTAGFWADARIINNMAGSGDCWALSSFVGFPARKLNWRVDRRSKPGPGWVFSRTLPALCLTRGDDPCDRFCLSW